MYQIYEVSTGAAVSNSSIEPVGLPAELAYKSFPDGDEDGLWNTSTLVFDTRPVRPEIISARKFFNRMTPDEQKAIILFSKTNADVELFLERLKISGEVEMDSYVQNGLLYLEAQAVLSLGRAADIFDE